MEGVALMARETDSTLPACMMRGVSRALSLSVARLLLCASLACCGGGSDTPAVSVELVLGTGEANFEPFMPGDPLELYAGTQGGHHVWLSVRVEGLEPEGILFQLDVDPTPPAPPALTEVQLDFVPVAGQANTYELVGWPARVLAPECVVGHPVTLTVRLEDTQGRVAMAETQVTPTAPQNGFSKPCESP